jgi:8-oxo-dGTP pyrophosphatase MutT (NUDIX family)
MTPQEKIKVKVFGLIKDTNQDNNRLFVYQGYDSIKQKTFYRALGGSIEFGENSYTALKREFQEEIQADLKNIEYVGCIENIFINEGQKGHEIIQVYQCDFVDPKFYQLDELTFFEVDNTEYKAMWIDVDRIKSGELWLVPSEFCNYL